MMVEASGAQRRRFAGEDHTIAPMASLADIERSGPLVIVQGRGVRLRDSAGREYLDGLSGLLNVNVGYGRAELAEVAADGLRRLSFATSFFGRSTMEELMLAEKLAAITPSGIDHFFFTVGGSDAIDTAIKFVRHHNVLTGQPEKTTVIARRDGYHGMTLGATTATGQPALRDRIGPLLPGVLHVGQPDPEDGRFSADELEQVILRAGPRTVAAFLAEPVALPPGVAIPPDAYWPAIRDVCIRYDVRLIMDEVVTGFGRTGRLFGYEHWGVEPDIMVLAKGLTSGYSALGAVGIRQDLFAGLRGSDQILPHGFTAGGHPVACAVALANIEIIERERLVENAATIGNLLGAQLTRMAERHPRVLAVRSLGMLAAFDLDSTPVKGDPPSAGATVTSMMADRGVLLRSYGNTIVVGPSLVADEEDIAEITGTLDSVLTDLETTGRLS